VNKNIIRPPKWADKLLQWYCSERFLEEIQGDLHEWFYKRVERHGLVRARIFYFLDVIRFFRTFRLKNINEIDNKPNQTMWINNIKLAIRGFRRNPFFAAINVLGLSMGIASSILIYLYINDELSYDKFNSNATRIHRAVLDLESQRGTTNYVTSPAALAPTVLNEATGVENAVRFYKQVNTMIQKDKDLYSEDGFYFADPSVFDIFTLPLIKGDPKTALQDPFKIVLSESKSKAYFGDRDSLGEILTINDTIFEVSGIMRDLPSQSHLDIEIMASFKSWEILVPSIANAFAPQMYYTYFLLENQSNPAEFEKMMNKIVANNVSFTSFVLNFKTQPLLDIHLYSQREGEIKVGGRSPGIWEEKEIPSMLLIFNHSFFKV